MKNLISITSITFKYGTGEHFYEEKKYINPRYIILIEEFKNAYSNKTYGSITVSLANCHTRYVTLETIEEIKNMFI